MRILLERLIVIGNGLSTIASGLPPTFGLETDIPALQFSALCGYPFGVAPTFVSIELFNPAKL